MTDTGRRMMCPWEKNDMPVGSDGGGWYSVHVQIMRSLPREEQQTPWSRSEKLCSPKGNSTLDHQAKEFGQEPQCDVLVNVRGMAEIALAGQNSTFPAEARSSASCVCYTAVTMVSPGPKGRAWGKPKTWLPLLPLWASHLPYWIAFLICNIELTGGQEFHELF